MFTDNGRAEHEKWAKWVADDEFDLSPNFIPDADTPQGAIDYYKYMLSDMVDFDAPDFSWPTGVGMCC